jgi:hypothetical protein
MSKERGLRLPSAIERQQARLPIPPRRRPWLPRLAFMGERDGGAA